MKSAAPMSASSARSSTCTNDFHRSASKARPSRRQRASAADAWPAAAEARPTLTKPSTGAATGVTLDTRHTNAVPCAAARAAQQPRVSSACERQVQHPARAHAPAPTPAWRCRPRRRRRRATQTAPRALPSAARRLPCRPTPPGRGASRRRHAPANQARASRRGRRRRGERSPGCQVQKQAPQAGRWRVQRGAQLARDTRSSRGRGATAPRRTGALG